MTTRATGTFEVKLTPQSTDEEPQGSTLGRLSIDKTFHGDLVAPDSGTGELAGLAGSMRIIVEPGKHSYEMDYTID